jgi:hypothetical protein
MYESALSVLFRFFVWSSKHKVTKNDCIAIIWNIQSTKALMAGVVIRLLSPRRPGRTHSEEL